MIGDINFDSFINIIDIVLLVNIVLSGDTSSISMCQFSNADSNFDSILNIQDIIALLNIILDI